MHKCPSWGWRQVAPADQFSDLLPQLCPGTPIRCLVLTILAPRPQFLKTELFYGVIPQDTIYLGAKNDCCSQREAGYPQEATVSISSFWTLAKRHSDLRWRVCWCATLAPHPMRAKETMDHGFAQVTHFNRISKTL